jgi:hypothetical protein
LESRSASTQEEYGGRELFKSTRSNLADSYDFDVQLIMPNHNIKLDFARMIVPSKVI